MSKINMAKKIHYSNLIGLWKGIKNSLVAYGPAILLLILNGYQDWMPDKLAISCAPIIGIVSHYLKNKIEFKKRNQ